MYGTMMLLLIWIASVAKANGTTPSWEVHQKEVTAAIATASDSTRKFCDDNAADRNQPRTFIIKDDPFIVERIKKSSKDDIGESLKEDLHKYAFKLLSSWPIAIIGSCAFGFVLLCCCRSKGRFGDFNTKVWHKVFCAIGINVWVFSAVSVAAIAAIKYKQLDNSFSNAMCASAQLRKSLLDGSGPEESEKFIGIQALNDELKKLYAKLHEELRNKPQSWRKQVTSSITKVTDVYSGRKNGIPEPSWVDLSVKLDYDDRKKLSKHIVGFFGGAPPGQSRQEKTLVERLTKVEHRIEKAGDLIEDIRAKFDPILAKFDYDGEVHKIYKKYAPLSAGGVILGIVLGLALFLNSLEVCVFCEKNGKTMGPGEVNLHMELADVMQATNDVANPPLNRTRTPSLPKFVRCMMCANCVLWFCLAVSLLLLAGVLVWVGRPLGGICHVIDGMTWDTLHGMAHNYVNLNTSASNDIAPSSLFKKCIIDGDHRDLANLIPMKAPRFFRDSNDTSGDNSDNETSGDNSDGTMTLDHFFKVLSQKIDGTTDWKDLAVNTSKDELTATGSTSEYYGILRRAGVGEEQQQLLYIAAQDTWKQVRNSHAQGKDMIKNFKEDVVDNLKCDFINDAYNSVVDSCFQAVHAAYLLYALYLATGILSMVLVFFLYFLF